MRAFLLKIIKMRRHMLNNGLSQKNFCMCMRHIAKVEPWLKAYPHASNQNVQRFARRHMDSFLYILPGRNHPAHNSLLEQFQTLINIDYEPKNNPVRYR